MRTISAELRTHYVNRRTRVLLNELQEACQHVLKLLAQLEMPGLVERQVDEILGELSAAVVHLHEHTRGLDTVIDRSPQPRSPSRA